MVVVVGCISITALTVSVISLYRREVEVRQTNEIYLMMRRLATEYDFATIIEHYDED